MDDHGLLEMIRAACLLFVAALLAVQALAGLDAAFGATREGQQAHSRYSADDPPQRYRSAVVTAKVTFLRGDALMLKMCGDPGFIACTDRRTKRIYVADPCLDASSYAQTLCHEIGHVLGWPVDHGP